MLARTRRNGRRSNPCLGWLCASAVGDDNLAIQRNATTPAAMAADGARKLRGRRSLARHAPARFAKWVYLCFMYWPFRKYGKICSKHPPNHVGRTRPSSKHEESCLQTSLKHICISLGCLEHVSHHRRNKTSANLAPNMGGGQTEAFRCAARGLGACRGGYPSNENTQGQIAT